MTSRRWEGTGPEYRIHWGGRDWALRLNAPHPGLYAEGCGPLLGLDGVTAPGRVDRNALSGATLVEWGCRFDHVEATYKPADWGEMTVRAAWSPAPLDDAIDLLVELSARSVGDLESVEVWTVSHLGPPSAESALSPPLSIRPDAPRDAQDLTPWISPGPGRDEATYIALAHPDDVRQRVVDERGRSVRHGLFGYDLERGVVLRGRLRAFWSRAADPSRAADEALAGWLREPLPLST